jgi:hypothetical protein
MECPDKQHTFHTKVLCILDNDILRLREGASCTLGMTVLETLLLCPQMYSHQTLFGLCQPAQGASRQHSLSITTGIRVTRMTRGVRGWGRFMEAWGKGKRNSSRELWRPSMTLLSVISIYHTINAQLQQICVVRYDF